GRPGVAFLDGAAHPEGLGRWSYLATDPVELLEGDTSDWARAAARIRATFTTRPPHATDEILPPFQGGWIGWLSYELGRAFDAQPLAASRSQQVAAFSLARHR